MRSREGELSARPAGRGILTSFPWKRTVGMTPVGAVRWIWSRAWRRTREMFPPAESPAKTIWDAGTGSWSAPAGG